MHCQSKVKGGKRLDLAFSLTFSLLIVKIGYQFTLALAIRANVKCGINEL